MYLALSQQHMYPWDQDVGGNCNMREKMDECTVFFSRDIRDSYNLYAMG